MSQEHERPWLEVAKDAVGDTSQQVDPVEPAPAMTIQPDASSGEPPEGVKALTTILEELAVILPALKVAIERDARKRQPPPVKMPLAHQKQDRSRMRGVGPRIVKRLLAADKLAGSQQMSPETILGSVYTAISAAHAMQATDRPEIFIAVMYLCVAMIHFIAPRIAKDA